MVVAMTAFQYPFYGIQWHPEVVLFAWATDLDFIHSPHAIAVSQYIADFFVTESEWCCMIGFFSSLYRESPSGLFLFKRQLKEIFRGSDEAQIFSFFFFFPERIDTFLVWTEFCHLKRQEVKTHFLRNNSSLFGLSCYYLFICFRLDLYLGWRQTYTECALLWQNEWNCLPVRHNQFNAMTTFVSQQDATNIASPVPRRKPVPSSRTTTWCTPTTALTHNATTSTSLAADQSCRLTDPTCTDPDLSVYDSQLSISFRLMVYLWPPVSTNGSPPMSTNASPLTMSCRLMVHLWSPVN